MSPRKAAVTVFNCDLGRRPGCTGPGCMERSAAACTYPVTRKGVKETCGRHLCKHCAIPRKDIGPDQFYCGTHDRMTGGKS